MPARVKPQPITAFLPKRLAKLAHRMMKMIVVPVPTMLTMLLNTSATLAGTLSDVPWAM